MTHSGGRRLGATLASLALLLAPAAAIVGSTSPAPAFAASGVTARVDPDLLPGRAAEDLQRVVVQGRPGATPEREVSRLGGTVTRALPLVHGFAATVPARAVPALAAVPGVQAVSADRTLRVQSSAGSGAAATTTGLSAPGIVRAPATWATGNRGQGVTVALVDTGVADVPELAGRVVPVSDELGRTASCYDLSGAGSCGDAYGHGTFMAGLIAGGGTRAVGTAPQAGIVSVKVAGADGASDVSTVLAAVQWVVSFRAQYGIGVLNLSLGTDSTQSWREDPLNYAVERAWDAGILIVTAAANNGPAAGTISKPADDPWVVTVAAVDDRGTAALSDDRVPDFSSRGPTREGVAKPDVVAPGGHVLSLRAPGSTIERDYPGGPAGPYRRGSGTSMAAAVVSGTAALVLSGHPELTPNRVKHVLRATARRDASSAASVVGTGLVDAYRAAVRPPAGEDNAGLAHSTGRGSLGASRGSLLMRTTSPPVLLTGRQTAQLLLWDPVAYTTGIWTPYTWYTSVNATVGWNTAQWADDPYTGHNWTGRDWTGSSWYGQTENRSSYGRTGPGSASYGGWD